MQDWPRALRMTVEAAESRSRDLKHGYIGTEHLLLGLLSLVGTRAARELTEVGVTLDRARSRVVRIVGVGEEDELPGSVFPYTPDAAAVCRRVVREGEHFGPAQVGTEHILRALLRRRSLAYHVVGDLGIDADALAARLRRARPDPE